MQKIYDDSGVTSLALSKINVKEPRLTINEAIELLVMLLEYGNRDV